MTANIIAFLAIRGGSKEIPNKNFEFLCNFPLYTWSMYAAISCELINEVFIAYDVVPDKQFLCMGNPHVQYIKVPKMDDSCIQEDRMIPFAKEHKFDHIILLQATSPLLTSEDLTKGIQTYLEGGYDSLVSVVRQQRHLWATTSGGHTYPLNFNPNNRQKRQDRNKSLIVENGAFFITSKEALLRTGNRTSGNTGLYFMPEDTYQEIDTPLDWEIVEMLLKRRLNNG